MPELNPVSLALRDLMDDVVYHGTNLVQGAFDLVCMAALGACVYAASLDGIPAPAARPDLAQIGTLPDSALPGAAPALCLAFSDPTLPADSGCITALVLDDQIGT